MRCPDDEKFAQYAEGKLNVDERSNFSEHLSECSECASLYAMSFGRDKSISECPGEESMAALAEGKLSRRQREALLKHIAVCETCAAEFYYIRKLKLVRTPVKVNKITAKNRNIFKLAAAAAIIILIVGLTGVYKLYYGGFMTASNMLYMKDNATISVSAPQSAAAPAMPPEIAREPAVEELQEIPANRIPYESSRKQEQGVSGYMQTNPVYEVVYNGHDGGADKIIRAIRLITGMDEERAKTVAESGSAVIKQYASIEEAQKVKKDLESAGARIEIRQNFIRR